MNSLTYKPSPIPSGGLEVPLLLRFKCDVKWTIDTMKQFVEQYYSYDFTGNIIIEQDDDDECEIDFGTVLLETEDEQVSDAVSDEEESEQEQLEWDLSGEMPVVNISGSDSE